jgi:DNA-directed RNA polymerase subunit M/transcription elongation factor TFIIS
MSFSVESIFPDIDELLRMFHERVTGTYMCSINSFKKEIMYHLKNAVSPEQIRESILHGNWMWHDDMDSTSTYDPIRVRVEAMFDTSSDTQGIIACICGSFNTVLDAKQTRSGDESMTVFVTCKDCGRKFKM